MIPKFKKLQPSHHPPRGPLGLTFIDVLIGISLMLIVFLGIFGAYRLGLKVVGQSKARIDATALANQRLEMVKNLPYEEVGTNEGGCHPCGTLEKTDSVIRNSIEYTIVTRIDYIADSADGIAGADDECPNDYKKVEIKISWMGQFSGEVSLFTDIAPKNLAQECAIGGGVLSVSVADVSGNMVLSPLIEVINLETDQIKTATPDDGSHLFSLAAGTYKVVVSKSDCNTERTYGTDEIATPEKPHPLVIEGELAEISFAGDFAIDKLSDFSVDTLSPWGMDYFSDSFLDNNKISESSSIVISGGEVNLSKTDGEYQNSGYLVSTTISPETLIYWDEFSFIDNEPAGTEILYQVLYFNEDEENWVPVPDEDLVGNSSGFDTSPVDLSELKITTYSQLELKANLSTTELAATPVLYDWQVSWKTSEATPIANAVFDLEGSKIIGYDADEGPIYKYSQEHISDGDGHLDIPDLGWDFYTFLIDPATDLDLVDIDPGPQPIYLSPDTTSAVKLYLDAENSLLVTVRDIDTGDPIPAANVKLSKIGYEETQDTGDKGQTYFIPLEVGTYTAEVFREGFQTKSEDIFVSGDKSLIISLQGI